MFLDNMSIQVTFPGIAFGTQPAVETVIHVNLLYMSVPVKFPDESAMATVAIVVFCDISNSYRPDFNLNSNESRPELNLNST